jgi:hypothetical protein
VDDGNEGLSADEAQRLRRYLRALTAVNRQLYDQLESSGARPVESARDPDLLDVDEADQPRARPMVLRRGEYGELWVEQLLLRGGASGPFLVRSTARGAFLVEGRMRRAINAGLLFRALERMLVERAVSDDDLDALEEGPPLEVLEGPSGPAFVIVGGRRYPVRGLPLPYAITADEMALFPEAQELRVGMSAPRGKADRARAVMEREGPVRGSVTVTSKAAKRVWRKVFPRRA